MYQTIGRDKHERELAVIENTHYNLIDTLITLAPDKWDEACRAYTLLCGEREAFIACMSIMIPVHGCPSAVGYTYWEAVKWAKANAYRFSS